MINEHFDFSRWEDAFNAYAMAAKHYGSDKIQFVCSEHPYTSGYWIEPAGTICSNGDSIVPNGHLLSYQARIRAEISTAKKERRIPRFVRYDPKTLNPPGDTGS